MATTYRTEYRVSCRTPGGTVMDDWLVTFDRQAVDEEIAESIALGADADAFTVYHRQVAVGDWAPTTAAPAQLAHPQQLADDPEPECGRSINLGVEDGTSCDREPGHPGVHRGPSPWYARSVFIWRGGGSCAGDPLPVHELRHLPAGHYAVPQD